ncbi:Uu.00g014430.m01.CDS01 [Anthostomella pinea]|uniref:Uu.00g014430.m01.CDS01 n=1 Tax=Anthostomella pinea TaxID=933095 RepID=A0AAI8YQ90_9PEZI|nr:Uu.00g014430.m01.CDS01 [Anthostomella pinea]
MAQGYVVPPKQPPQLNIPKSDVTVKVSCVDSTSRLDLGPLGPFLQPDYTGRNKLLGPALSFLIEHPQRKPVLFDLAIRKDFHVLPSYPKFVEMKWGIHVDKDVSTILKENGVDVDGGAIQSIIWSHHHWDHVGNPTLFPGSTELVVGPGSKDMYLPGYLERQDSILMATDFEGRNVRELSFDDSFKIGRFRAFDFFGDGSFYLLDTPGHSVGHMCGLARTSTHPDTFIFMGGDASHHGGEFRPTDYSPLPKELNPMPPRRRNQGEFDAHEKVLLLMAHDDSVIDPPQSDFYPKTMNYWYEKGVGKRVKWLFLGDFEGVVKANQRGEEVFTWGEHSSWDYYG